MKNRGFTLIELLVVVAIIGMLSSVVLSSLNVARANARDAKRAADLQQIVNALELYVNVTGTYPIHGGNNYGCGDSTCLIVLTEELVNTGYIGSIPLDPLYGNIPSYGYRYVGYGSSYNLLRWSEKNRSTGTPGWCHPAEVAPGPGWQGSTYPRCPA